MGYRGPFGVQVQVQSILGILIIGYRGLLGLSLWGIKGCWGYFWEVKLAKEGCEQG